MKVSHIKIFLDAMASTRAAIFAAAYLVLATSAVSGADKTGVTLRGSYEYSVYQGSTTPRYSARYNFEASIAGRSWIIEYADTSALTNADTLNARAVVSCDGTNIYLVQFQNERAVRKAWGDRYASVKHELPIAMATIYPGDYPPPRESVLQHIWLAYASSSVLADARGKAKPPFVADLATFCDTNYNCDYYWITNAGSRQLILKTDGHWLEEVWINGQKQHVKLAAPYDQGYTNGVGAGAK